MQSDPLQQLKTLHLPPEPSWWPPAIGWWLLLLMGIILITWVVFRIVRHFQATKPIRHGKLLIDKLYKEYQDGAISEERFAHAANQIIKRVLVPGLGKQQYAKLSGDEWLKALDQISETNRFTQGEGAILGNKRFRPDPTLDPKGLYNDLQNLFRRIRL